MYQLQSEDCAAASANETICIDSSKEKDPRCTKAAQVLDSYRLDFVGGRAWPPSIDKALVKIEAAIDRNAPIEMVVPAFPFKSPNHEDKVLGTLPDEAERMSLKHLDSLCASLSDVTGGQVHLHIVSDGISYNDLLGVSDETVWEYGQALREMAIEQNCRNLQFVRMADLLYDADEKTTLTKLEYLKRVGTYRALLEGFLPRDYNVDRAIEVDHNTLLTYRGYRRFLLSDLKADGCSRKQRDKENAEIARSMLKRGKAFAELIKAKFPGAIRLSVHPSNDNEKVSVAMLPQESRPMRTPWHGVLVRKADGTIVMAHKASISLDTHQLVYASGRPSFFREKSDSYYFSTQGLYVEHIYPSGLVIRPSDSQSISSLSTEDMQKIRKLAEVCSPVVLRGFCKIPDESIFLTKARELGTLHGNILKLRDEGNAERGSNIQTSREAMPMHYDGVFHLKTEIDPETGVSRQVSDVPRFQMFVCRKVAKSGNGHTLFASSALFSKHLPHPWTMEQLSKLTWSCETSGFFASTLSGLPLVVRHPSTGAMCLRWHEDWDSAKTQYAGTISRIENGPSELVGMLERLIYDRRVCLRIQWQEGDVVISDNVAMLHTRTGFENGDKRELWRVHVN